MAHDARLIKSEDRIESSGNHPGLDQAPGAADDAVHRSGLRAARRHPRGRHRAARSPSPMPAPSLLNSAPRSFTSRRPGGDVFRFTAPQLTCGGRARMAATRRRSPRTSCRWGSTSSRRAGIELLMALWKISDVWMESSAPGTLRSLRDHQRVGARGQPQSGDRAGQHLRAIRQARSISDGPDYDAIAQAYGGMMNLTGDPAGPPQRAKTYTGDYVTRADRMGGDDDGAVGGQEERARARSSTSRNTRRWRRPTATPCRSSPARARSTGIPVTARRGSSPTTRSNAATAGSLSARSAGRSTTGCRNSSGSTRSNTATTHARRMQRR